MDHGRNCCFDASIREGALRRTFFETSCDSLPSEKKLRSRSAQSIAERYRLDRSRSEAAEAGQVAAPLYLAPTSIRSGFSGLTGPERGGGEDSHKVSTSREKFDSGTIRRHPPLAPSAFRTSSPSTALLTISTAPAARMGMSHESCTELEATSAKQANGLPAKSVRMLASNSLIFLWN